MISKPNITGTRYSYNPGAEGLLTELDGKVVDLRSSGRLDSTVLKRLSEYFRIKSIYNSNAIEGNALDYNETKLVVEQGLTISGKSLKDTLEAKNLSHALGLFEELANRESGPISEADVRSLHMAVLKEVNDREAGKYRDVEVAISGSKHKPPGPESVAPEMEKFGTWLKVATSPATPLANPVILAAVAHTWFVSIHPFIDGNGRVARLLLNLLLMRYGYPIVVIAKEDRFRYYEALGESDRDGDLTSLLTLLIESVGESLDEYMSAVKEKRADEEWAKSLLSTVENRQKTRVHSDYSVWMSAMDLLKQHFKRTGDLLNTVSSESRTKVHFDVKEFGAFEFEKYWELRDGRAAKKTWFFAIDARIADRQSRYLFWGGFATPSLKHKLSHQDATLHVSFSDGGPIFQSLESGGRDLPDLCEIGYNPESERYHWRLRDGHIKSGRIEEAARQFFTQVANRQS